MNEPKGNPAKKLIAAALVVVAVGVGIWAVVTMDLFAERQSKPVLVAKVDPALLKWRQVRAFDTGMTGPKGLAVVAGAICVVGDRALVTFRPDGQVISRRGLPAEPSCVAVGPGGRVLVGLGDRIAWFDAAGKITALTPPGEKTPHISSILATSGSLYATDAVNAVVWRTSDAGRTWSQIDGRTENDRTGFVLRSTHFEFDLDVGPHGRLRIVNPGLLRVEAYTPDGVRKFMWGKEATTVDGFGGCCNPAHIAIAPDGSIVTAEKSVVPAKVKIFAPDGPDAQSGRVESVVADASQFKDPSISLDVAVDAEGRVVVLELVKGGRVRIFERQGAGPERKDDE